MSRLTSVTDFPRNEAGLVGEFIGTAYDTVKRVYDNLGEIQRLDLVLTEIEDVATVVANQAIDAQMPVFVAKLDDMVVDAKTELNVIADRADTAAEATEAIKDQAIAETTQIKDLTVQAKAETFEIRDQTYTARDEVRELVDNFDSTARVKVYAQMPNPLPMYELFMVLDEIKPVVTAFTVTSNVVSPLPVTSFQATDDNGVTGWWIGETSGTPALSDPNWRSNKPTSYATSTVGATTLYARVRDAAGNVSDAVSVPVSVLNNPYVDVNWPYNASRDTGIFPIGAGTAVYSSAPEYTPSQTVTIKSVGLVLYKDPTSATGTATLQLTIRSGAPDGTILATATIPSISNTTPEGKTFTLPSNITLSAGTKYFFTVAATSATGTSLFRISAQSGVGVVWSKDNANAWTSYVAQSPMRLEKA